MKTLIKIVSFSLLVLFLPVTIYSFINNFFHSENNNLASKYDFVASAEFGEGSDAGESACESAAAESCCQGEGGEGK